MRLPLLTRTIIIKSNYFIVLRTELFGLRLYILCDVNGRPMRSFY